MLGRGLGGLPNGRYCWVEGFSLAWDRSFHWVSHIAGYFPSLGLSLNWVLTGSFSSLLKISSNRVKSEQEEAVSQRKPGKEKPSKHAPEKPHARGQLAASKCLLSLLR
jgi:hypothetical protein